MVEQLVKERDLIQKAIDAFRVLIEKNELSRTLQEIKEDEEDDK